MFWACIEVHEGFLKRCGNVEGALLDAFHMLNEAEPLWASANRLGGRSSPQKAEVQSEGGFRSSFSHI